MATLEQVERLRERADVTYDEAKAALEATDGDLLEALILLEREGKTRAPASGGFTSTNSAYNAANGSQEQNDSYQQYASQPKQPRGETFGDLMRRFGSFCLRALKLGNTNFFEISKDGDVKASLPLTVLVLIGFFTWWLFIPLIVLGLFFGLRYRFTGPNMNSANPVNDTMDSAADAAINLKNRMAEEEKNDNHQNRQ